MTGSDLFFIGHFYAREESSRKPVRVSISDGHIFVTDEKGQQFSINFSTLHIKACGTNDSAVTLAPISSDEFTIIVDDEAFITALKKINNPSIKKQISELNAGARRFYMFISAIVGLVVIIGSITLLGRDYFFEKLADYVPRDVDAFIAKAVKDMKKPGAYNVNEEIRRKFSDLTQNIMPITTDENPNFQFEINIVSGNEPNAFAYPGGYIEITDSLILQAQSVEEILGVLAHEITHVQKRHSMKMLVRTLGVYMTTGLIFGDVEKVIGIDSLNRLMGLRFSREAEHEADEGALMILKARGINSKGMRDFFERAAKTHSISKGAAQLLSFMSTHPSYPERSEFFKKHEDGAVAAAVQTRTISFDLESFKSLIKNMRAQKKTSLRSDFHAEDAN